MKNRIISKNEELPGRLGNKDLTINEDKRINQNLLQAMKEFGLDGVSLLLNCATSANSAE